MESIFAGKDAFTQVNKCVGWIATWNQFNEIYQKVLFILQSGVWGYTSKPNARIGVNIVDIVCICDMIVWV